MQSKYFGHERLARIFHKIGLLLTPSIPEHQNKKSLSALIQSLQQLTQRDTSTGLKQYGLTPNNLEKILQNGRSVSMLRNPVTLNNEQLPNALKKAL